VAYVAGGAEPPEDLPDQLELTSVVRDDGGLAGALEPISAGQAGTLFVHRLESVAGSFGELIRLLDWLAAAGADLVAADVALDTASPQGRRMVALLREIDRWSREPDRPRRPRGRPGLAAGAPHVAERIAELRERGLSLQAIADALNDESVPTPRGGARWRPSSVQSALGYRRPRPPAPGAPPPRPPHPPGAHPPGPSEAGPSEAGPSEAGPSEAGPSEAGRCEGRPPEAGPPEVGPPPPGPGHRHPKPAP
jgi:Resolvase, N terminal domain/Recombinase